MRILVSEAGAPQGEEMVADLEISSEAERNKRMFFFDFVVGFSFGSSLQMLAGCLTL